MKMDFVTMMMNVMEREYALLINVLEQQDLKKMLNINTMKQKQETDVKVSLLIIYVMETDIVLITDGVKANQDDLIYRKLIHLSYFIIKYNLFFIFTLQQYKVQRKF